MRQRYRSILTFIIYIKKAAIVKIYNYQIDFLVLDEVVNWPCGESLGVNWYLDNWIKFNFKVL